MADEQTATLEPTTTTTEGGQQFDLDKAHDAAEQFLAATRAELETETQPTETKAAPARGPDGKFLPKDSKATGQQGNEATEQTAASDETPTVDPVWLDLAKEEGLPEDAIKNFKTEAEIEAAIQTNRVQKVQGAAQLLGIDPVRYRQYMEWQQSQQANMPAGQQTAQSQTQTQPAATAIEEVKLDLDEDELDPKVLATIKALTAQVNKLGTVAVDNQKLSQKLAELEGHVRQSAMQAQAAQVQAQYAESWDKAASKIPDFKEYFGKPSDLLRLSQTQPDHERVLDYVGFDARFQKVWNRYTKGYQDANGRFVPGLGESDTTLYLALRDTWNASPYSKIASGNGNGRSGTNGSAQYGNGSVVRQPARRTGQKEPMPAQNVEAEMGRSLAAISEQWDAKGENPFKDLGF